MANLLFAPHGCWGFHSRWLSRKGSRGSGACPGLCGTQGRGYCTGGSPERLGDGELVCKGEPSAGRWPHAISREGSNLGALSRGHPDAKVRHQGFFSLVLAGESSAKQVHPDFQSSPSQDGQPMGECSSLPTCHCLQQPSSAARVSPSGDTSS